MYDENSLIQWRPLLWNSEDCGKMPVLAKATYLQVNNMCPDFVKPTELSHRVSREIPILNIQPHATSLACAVANLSYTSLIHLFTS